MKRFWVLIGFLCMAGSAVADSQLRAFQTVDDSRGWEAVGRLDFGTRSFCTGTLISETLVLTAAHCMYDTQTHVPHRPQNITFKAGWRNGFAQALRSARAIYVHPEFSLSMDNRHDRLENDLALVELESPVHTASVRPFETSVRPRNGQEVGVVSYALDRSESPSMQKICHVVARQGGVLVTSCDVDFGSSGAPVFDMSGATPRIVSVISAKAKFQGSKVAVSTALDGTLAELMRLVARGKRQADASAASGAEPPVPGVKAPQYLAGQTAP